MVGYQLNETYYVPEQLAILSKILNLEYARITPSPMAWIENDANGCYQTISSIEFIKCSRYGARKKGWYTQAKIWNNLQHAIKTSHGTSVSTYLGLPEEFHAGRAQEAA